MGCDIHCYIEYKNDELDRWWCFGGRINPGRCYTLFGRMAGVRGDEEPIVERRGYPKDAGYAAASDNHLFIVDVEDTDHPEYCTRILADRWLASGTSQLKEGNDCYVTHPDWHSHSWLTPDEFEEVLDGFLMTDGYVKYHCFLAVLRTLENAGYKARLVFWFDN